MTNISIERKGNDTLIRFSQDLDAATVPEYRTAIDTNIDDKDIHFIVDISNVTFIDSHGVGLFVSLLKKAHNRHGKLSFQGAQEQPLSVLKMVGFNNDLVEYLDASGKKLAG